MLEVIKTAVPLGFLLSFMIGPVFFVLLETGATKGFRAAMFLDFGVIFADIFFILIAYFASYQLIENLSNEPGLYVAGGMILLVYGIISIFKNTPIKSNQKKIKGTYITLFIKGFFLNIINIGVLAFWLGVWFWAGPTYDNDTKKIIWFFVIVVLTYFAVDVIKVLLAKELRKKLTPVRIVVLKKVLGVILVVCGLVLVTKGFVPNTQLDVTNQIERF